MYQARKSAILPILTEGLKVTVGKTVYFGVGQRARWSPGDIVTIEPDPGPAQANAWGLAPYKEKEADDGDNHLDRRESKSRRE